MKTLLPTIGCWLAISLMLSSCDREQKVVAEAVSGRVMKTADFKVGEYNQDGRLVFWEIHAFDHMEPFVLYEDYGVMLVNEGGEEAPRPLYILARQKTKEVFTTDDFEVFHQELVKIPRDAVIGCYGTCSMPRTWGLPEQMVETYQGALTELESTNKVENWTVCYCPNRN